MTATIAATALQIIEADGAFFVAANDDRVAGPFTMRKNATRRLRQLELIAAVATEAAPQAEPEVEDEPEVEADLPNVDEEEDEAEEEDDGEDEYTPAAPAERRPANLVPPMAIVTREDWLLAGSIMIAQVLSDKAGLDLPAFRVTCGWPHKGGTARKRVLGQCWNPEASSDQHAEIFISPMESEARTVIAVLAHELIHACLPLGTGHKAPFVNAAKAIGFEKPFTQLNPSDDLWAWADPILAMLPEYPHARLNPAGAEGDKKKQTARLLKAECEECGYTVRVTKKWLAAGAPICPCNREPMRCEGMEGEGGDQPEGEGDE